MTKYFLRLLRKLHILDRVAIYPVTTIAGVKFRIPIINGVGIGNYLNLGEPWMQTLLIKLVDDQKTFLDIGVNLGQTLIKVKAINKTIHYLGFEPNPSCVNYVNELIRINKLNNTTIVPAGIGERNTIRKLNLFNEETHDSSASIIEDFRDPQDIIKSIHVPIFNWAEVPVQAYGKIGIIKIDVEGAELEVLKGLKSLIESNKPLILLEILPAYSEENHERILRQETIENLLRSLEYTVFRIVKKDQELLKIVEIESIGIHSDLNSCDYILAPNDRVQELKSILSS